MVDNSNCYSNDIDDKINNSNNNSTTAVTSGNNTDSNNNDIENSDDENIVNSLRENDWVRGNCKISIAITNNTNNQRNI